MHYVVTSPTYYQETVVVQPPVYTESSEGLVNNAPASSYIETGVPSSETPDYAGTTIPPQTENEQAPSTDDRLFQQMFEGTKAFYEGQYDAAARMFFDVSMQDPDNVDGTLAYAVARFATGDYAISAIAIRRGIRRVCEVVNSGFDIRDRYSKPEDFEQHVQMLEDYLAEHPENADAVLVAGFVLHFAGQYDEAAEVFNELKRLSPSDADVADCFLNADPPEDIERSETDESAEQSEPNTTAPQSEPTL